MDAYDYLETDKEMSRRLEQVYSDPSRHAFLSERQGLQDYSILGPRGGQPRRQRKRICFHCGQKQPGHAQKTEDL